MRNFHKSNLSRENRFNENDNNKLRNKQRKNVNNENGRDSVLEGKHEDFKDSMEKGKSDKKGETISQYNQTSLIEIDKEKQKTKIKDLESESQVNTPVESEEEESTENEEEYEEEEEEEEEEEGDEEEEEEQEEEEEDDEDDRKKKEEIKELANICMEKNMVITKENIQIVRKLRERRKLEEQINKNENIKSLHEKRKILEEIEFHEWADREKRIKELQEKKMKLLKKIIEDRDAEKSEKVFYEIEKIMQNRDENKDKIIENFNIEKARDMRNFLSENEKNMKAICNTKSDVIDEMSNYTSDYYLQLERKGKVPNKLNESSINRIDHLINLNNLNKLEGTFNDDFYKSSNNLFNTRCNKNVKYADTRNKQLINTFNRYLNKNDDRKAISANNYFLNDAVTDQVKTQYMKMQFPTLDVKNPEQEAFEQNVLTLQNALRGKVLKKLMKDGIDTYGDLIEELKTVERINKYSNEKKEFFEKENFESIKIDSYVDNIQGKCISELLDKLSNELEKYEEERKIAVMIKYAERERRMKECKEKGKRQAEILLREKEDYLFNEIMGLNNKTVDSYLEDILGTTVTNVSKEEALIRTKEKAKKLNDIYNSLENNEENNKMIIKDLVGNFVIPYVNEHRGLEMEELKQKKKDYVTNFATQAVLSKFNEAF